MSFVLTNNVLNRLTPNSQRSASAKRILLNQPEADRFIRQAQPKFSGMIEHTELPDAEDWEHKYFTLGVIDNIFESLDLKQIASVSPTVVDIGAGRGTLFFPALERMKKALTQQGLSGNPKGYSLDIDPKMVDFCRNKAEETGINQKADVHSIEYDVCEESLSKQVEGIDGQVGLVILSSIFHGDDADEVSVEQRKKMMQEAYRLLAPGGRLLLTHWFRGFEERGPKPHDLRPLPADLIKWGFIGPKEGDFHGDMGKELDFVAYQKLSEGLYSVILEKPLPMDRESKDAYDQDERYRRYAPLFNDLSQEEAVLFFDALVQEYQAKHVKYGSTENEAIENELNAMNWMVSGINGRNGLVEGEKVKALPPKVNNFQYLIAPYLFEKATSAENKNILNKEVGTIGKTGWEVVLHANKLITHMSSKSDTAPRVGDLRVSIWHLDRYLTGSLERKPDESMYSENIDALKAFIDQTPLLHLDHKGMMGMPSHDVYMPSNPFLTHYALGQAPQHLTEKVEREWEETMLPMLREKMKNEREVT